jgi:hypothetical protein
MWAGGEDNDNQQDVGRQGRRIRQRRRQIEPSVETSQLMDGHDERSDFNMVGNVADIYVNGPPTGAERRLRQPDNDNDHIGRGTRNRRQVRRY